MKIGVMYLSGIGYKDLVHYRFTGEKEYPHSLYETIIQIGSQHFWLWTCIEPVNRSVLGIYKSE
jgi:hypothetical protein